MTDRAADSTPGPDAVPAAHDPLTAALQRTPVTEDAHMTPLLALLAIRADHDGLLDVAYTTTDSPLGPLLLAATTTGLVRVAYQREDHDAVLARLADQISPRVLRGDGTLGGYVGGPAAKQALLDLERAAA